MSEWWLILLLGVLSLSAIALIIYPIKKNKLLLLLLTPALFISLSIGYFYWGGFTQWKHYLHRTDSQKLASKMLESIKSPDELIDKLKAKLDDNPQSAKGWYLLGRLYSSQNQNQKAVEAFAKAHKLKPQDEQFTVNYAHSLWQMNNQQFNEEIIGIFNRLLQDNPNQADALAMLAMNAFMSHAYEDAIGFWQRLLRMAPEQSEESQAIRRAIAKAQEKLNTRSISNE